jgi:hypothetical protein
MYRASLCSGGGLRPVRSRSWQETADMVVSADPTGLTRGPVVPTLRRAKQLVLASLIFSARPSSAKGSEVAPLGYLIHP